MADTERREHPRIEINWPIILSTKGGKIKGEALNISVDGISFCCDEPISMKEMQHMFIQPPRHEDVLVTGQITWSDLYGMDNESKIFCMGLSFMQISEQDRSYIEDVIEEHIHEDVVKEHLN